ncbi:MAG: acyl-CoA dehydrogenase [Alphaproteobacteria bacterium]|nr:acyl-CoA dehydrogenase [Alphaproteobacteria bacterium]
MITQYFNRRDLDFLLYEVLEVQSLCQRPRYAAHDRTSFDAILDTASALAINEFAPHAAKSDANEPSFDGTRVHLIPEIKQALNAYVATGLMGATFDEEVGGLQLPVSIAQATNAMFYGANVGTAAYPLLAAGAANLISAVGSAEQKNIYMRPIVQGRWFGTMCLSEPQAGSSLADITAKATPTAAGHYLITGTKMWISGGEHDLSENIVHMVLAKIPGGGPGVKGISLFIVPKFRVNPDGSIGARNGVVLAGLNHKMGYRGTVNTVLNFGESTECHGYLVGEPHKGLAYMFHMMNEARIGVGLGATMCGYAGYLASLAYARERKQGRRADAKSPNAPQIPIIEHADIRRLLLTQKCYVEGALALELYCARLMDDQRTETDPAKLKNIGLLLDILTPIAKSWPSEFCLEANKHAIQVLGGYGYTRDFPVERLYRDNRLNAIHEGTHGIQALDLLGRKVAMDNKAALRVLGGEIHKTIDQAQTTNQLTEYADALTQAWARTIALTDALLVARVTNPKAALANAGIYLDMFGHAVIAWIWLIQAIAAAKAAPKTESERAFYDGKLAACRFFVRYELPKTQAQAALLESLDDTPLRIDDAGFA